ncbi:hypothetical protein HOB30_01165 [Candidatus Falkowbacteria bacterium]|nr:hypothetical protein [Candidatus Falkowbacteria bacterium]
MLALILLGFGALFVAIPIIFSGKGTGWFSSVREGNFQAPAHAREKLDSVFGANAQNPDPEHSDSGRKLMEGSDRRS